MYICERWAIKKAEHLELCWRKLLRVSWTARRSNQSILKEINPEYSLEGLMLKLRLQCFGHLLPRAHPLDETLMLVKTEGKRKRWGQRRKWLDSITDSMGMNMSKLWEIVKDREAWCAAVPWSHKESDRTWRPNTTTTLSITCGHPTLGHLGFPRKQVSFLKV